MGYGSDTDCDGGGKGDVLAQRGCTSPGGDCDCIFVGWALSEARYSSQLWVWVCVCARGSKQNRTDGMSKKSQKNEVDRRASSLDLCFWYYQFEMVGLER